MGYLFLDIIYITETFVFYNIFSNCIFFLFRTLYILQNLNIHKDILFITNIYFVILLKKI